jgi:hypothetical protein
MAAYFDPKAGFVFTEQILDRKKDAVTTTLLECEFDRGVDFDVAKAKAEVSLDNYYRGICIIRTLAFPIDYLGGLILLGSQHVRKRIELQRVMWRFLRRRITRQELLARIVQVGV